MPTASCSAWATGAKQLVVQEALETTLCSGVSTSSLTPYTTVASASGLGAEISTRPAPAARCLAAASRLVNRPVHSITRSTPSDSQGSAAGSRSERMAMRWPSTLMLSSSCSTL